MNRLFIIALSLVLVLSLAACGAKAPVDGTTVADTTDAEAPDGQIGGVGIPNPIKEVASAEEIKAALGFSLKAPADATDVAYMTRSDELGQIKVTSGGADYTLRGAKELEETALHGVYYNKIAEKTSLTVKDAAVSVAYTDDNPSHTIAVWSADGVNFSLTAAGKIEAPALSSVLEAILK